MVAKISFAVFMVLGCVSYFVLFDHEVENKYGEKASQVISSAILVVLLAVSSTVWLFPNFR